jgi:hypothetical protein
MISISLPLAIFAVSFSVDGQVRELGFEYMENCMSYVALYMIQLIQEIGIMTKKFPPQSSSRWTSLRISTGFRTRSLYYGVE